MPPKILVFAGGDERPLSSSRAGEPECPGFPANEEHSRSTRIPAWVVREFGGCPHVEGIAAPSRIDDSPLQKGRPLRSMRGAKVSCYYGH
jgi:hypothetical protein